VGRRSELQARGQPPVSATRSDGRVRMVGRVFEAHALPTGRVGLEDLAHLLTLSTASGTPGSWLPHHDLGTGGGGRCQTWVWLALAHNCRLTVSFHSARNRGPRPMQLRVHATRLNNPQRGDPPVADRFHVESPRNLRCSFVLLPRGPNGPSHLPGRVSGSYDSQERAYGPVRTERIVSACLASRYRGAISPLY